MPGTTPNPVTRLPEPAGIFYSPGQRKLVWGLLLVVVTLVLYNPVARNGFVNFDDDRYVTGNPHVQSGLRLSTLSWSFTTLDFANWHPLTWLSYELDYQLFKLNPAGYHYTSLLWHAANGLLLFLILRWFTGSAARSLMVAALFALHPLNVESVAWIAERKNVLSMFFFLLTLAAYGWYVRKPGVLRYGAVTSLFAMALMSKPMVITLPFVLLLLDYWPLGRLGAGKLVERRASPPAGAAASNQQPEWKLCLEKLPLLALSAGSALVTMMAQRAGGAVLTSAAHNSRLRFENVIVSYARYIQKTIWPAHLAALYPYPHSLPAGQVAVSALLLLAITAAVVQFRERRYLVVGWLWFLGTMVPMIGLIQVGNQAMADRHAYLPAVGLFIMFVWTAAGLLDVPRLSTRRVAAKILAPAGIAILLVLSFLTRTQIACWHDDLTLWSHALAVTQNNFVAENNLASALITQGRYEEAIPHFRAASALEPGDATSQLNLGIYAQQHGDLPQAAARYAYVLRLATDTQLRASAYANLGTVEFALHDYAPAQQNFDAAIRLQRVFPVALLDMGVIAMKTAHSPADYNRAAIYFEQYAAVQPTGVGYLLLARALQQAGRADEANRAYQRAQQGSPDITAAQQQAAQFLAQ